MKKSILVTLVLFLLVGLCGQPVFALEKLNINQATLEQLVEIKGIGPKIAEKIISYRASHKFSSVDQLAEIKGIGDKLLARIKNQLTVEDVVKK